MPNPAKSYVCPKCLYDTTLKKRIKMHFYELKKPCKNETGIELTDDIKEYVLEHRKYIPLKNNTNNVINNYNTLNNFIVQMDLTEKMEHLLIYQNKKTLDFETNLENHFEKKERRLNEDKYPCGYYLTHEDIFGLVNDVTKINPKNLEQLNVFFNRTVKRFEIYRGMSWESYLEEMGAKELISLIKSYYLDSYELYLIRNLHKDDGKINRIQLKEHLGIYYSFIAVFELTPCVIDNSDIEILSHKLKEHNDYYLGETYMNMYQDKKTGLGQVEKNKIRRKVVNIVKENTVHNISEINKAILDILKIDENFKNQLLKSHQLA